MSEYAIDGQKVTMRFLMNGEMVGYACATSCSFYCDDELIEKADVNGGRFKQFASRRAEWGMSIAGITHVAYSASAFTVFDSLIMALRASGLDVEMAFVDSLGNIKTISGHVLIPHTGINSSVDNFSEDEIDFKGSGPFTMAETLLNPTSEGEMKTIELWGDGTNAYVQDNLLIGEAVVPPNGAVFRAGAFYKVITTGTPGPLEAKFTTGTGRIDFDTVVGTDEMIKVFYK